MVTFEQLGEWIRLEVLYQKHKGWSDAMLPLRFSELCELFDIILRALFLAGRKLCGSKVEDFEDIKEWIASMVAIYKSNLEAIERLHADWIKMGYTLKNEEKRQCEP